MLVSYPVARRSSPVLVTLQGMAGFKIFKNNFLKEKNMGGGTETGIAPHHQVCVWLSDL